MREEDSKACFEQASRRITFFFLLVNPLALSVGCLVRVRQWSFFHLPCGLSESRRDPIHRSCPNHHPQVAKSSKTPRDVSYLVEHASLQLIREGRAETDRRSLDAMKVTR